MLESVNTKTTIQRFLHLVLCARKTEKEKIKRKEIITQWHTFLRTLSPFHPLHDSSFSSSLFRKHEALKLRASRVSINPPAEPSVVIRPHYSRASPRLTVSPTESLPRHLVFASNTSVLVFLPPSRVNTQTHATPCNSQELPFTRGAELSCL